MAEPNTRPVTIEELLVSSLAQTDALTKLLIEKGLIYARRVYAEDFRRTGDVSEAIESDAPMSVAADAGGALLDTFSVNQPDISCGESGYLHQSSA
jgi:hypothetical protein